MPINVTEFINTAVKNNPKANAEVKAGASTAAALFSSLQSGGVNASTLFTLTDNLPASVKSNISSFTSQITGNIGSPSAAAGQQKASASKNLGPEQSRNQPFSQGATRDLLTAVDAPIGAPTPKVKSTIPQLRESDIKSLMIQIAFMETAGDSTYNTPPRIGKYAVHNKTLINYGYKFSNGAAYTGKDGVTTETEFTFDTNVQDRIMEKFLLNQYQACIKAGAIKDNDTKEVVAGMLAVAYQFQDANPSLQQGLSSATGLMGSLGSADTAGLVSAASGLESSLSSSLLSGSGASIESVTNNVLSSGISNIEKNISGSLPQLGSIASATLSDKKAITGISSLTTAATKAAESVKAALTSGVEGVTGQLKIAAGKLESVKTALAPGLEGSAAQLKTAAAKIDVSKLKAAGDDFSNSLPANKAKDWRQTGKEKDSQGRPGALFYNAGRFAIQNLSADVSTESLP